MNRTRYRYKHPTIIDAIQFTGTNVEEVIEWFGAVEHHKALRVSYDLGTLRVAAQPLGLVIHLRSGDWLIVKADGMVVSSSDQTFRETYEVVS